MLCDDISTCYLEGGSNSVRLTVMKMTSLCAWPTNLFVLKFLRPQNDARFLSVVVVVVVVPLPLREMYPPARV